MSAPTIVKIHPRPLKAYMITCRDDDHGGEVRFAQTAKMLRGYRPSDSCDCEYIDLRVNRAKEFDEHSPGPVTIQQYLSHGWMWPCCACEDTLYEDQSPIVIEENWVYCNRECVQKDFDRHMKWAGEDPPPMHESMVRFRDAMSRWLEENPLAVTTPDSPTDKLAGTCSADFQSEFIAAALRAESKGRVEWRVRDKDTHAYCMHFDRDTDMFPSSAAEEWLKTEKQRFPDYHANNEVAEVTVLSKADRLMQQAANIIERPFCAADVRKLQAWLGVTGSIMTDEAWQNLDDKTQRLFVSDISSRWIHET